MTTDKYAEYEAKLARLRDMAEEIRPANKQALSEFLRPLGLVTVTIDFDGSGDSGQFEPAMGFDADMTLLPVPDGQLAVQVADFETSTVISQIKSVHHVVARHH
jgi:hypothetical protein